MSWSGGVYTKGNAGSGGWAGDAASGIGIEAGRHDTQDNDFATGINQCLNKDGSNAATGNLNLNSNKITNLAAATSRGDAAQTGQVQDGSFIWLGTTGGTATAQTATTTPALTGYVAGQKFRMKIGASLGSTGAATTPHTININGLGAKNIVEQDGANPTIGSWVAGAIMELVYDGTNFVMTNNPCGWQTYNITTSNLTGTSPVVVSAINTVEVSRFIKSNKLVTWQIGVNFALSAGGASTLNIVPPVNASANIAASNAFWGNGVALDSVAGKIAGAYFINATNMKIFRDTLTAQNWVTGAANNYARITINYESV